MSTSDLKLIDRSIGAIPLQRIAVHVQIARATLIDGMNDQRSHAVRRREAALKYRFLEVHMADDRVPMATSDSLQRI